MVTRFKLRFYSKRSFFEAVKLTKNGDRDKNSDYYMLYRLDSRLRFLCPGFDWGKNVVIFGVDSSSLVYVNNKKKHVLVIGEGLTQVLLVFIYLSLFVYVFIIMEAKVFYLLMPQKYINLKEKNYEIKP